MKNVSRIAACLFLLATLAAAQTRPADDVPMKAMRDELARSTTMHLPDMGKPYYVAYHMQDITDVSVAASLGSVTSSQTTRARVLRVELRVGDYKLDNTNFLSFNTRQASGFGTTGSVAIDDDYTELRREIWIATDSEYKKAVELFAAKQAALQNQTHGEDIPDFTREPRNQYFAARTSYPADTPALEEAARQISDVFRRLPDPQTSQVTIDAHTVYTRYINSEGTEYTRPDGMVFIEIKATTQATDGLPLQDTEQVFLKPGSKVDTADLTARASKMMARIEKLRTSATLDRYNGPVLFENQAGAELFSQMFAPAIVASRDPVTDNPRAQGFLDQMTSRFGGGTLKDRVGGRVLPDYVTVTDNPEMNAYEGQPLMGAYAVDEDGLPSKSKVVVQSGILKLLLSTRVPTAGVTQSTANHRGFGASPSNLIFTASKTSTNQELRQQLLQSAKARGLDYAVIVRHAGGSASEFIQNAVAMMQGGTANGNNMLEVYKVFPDGHEELVHGVQLVELNAASFKDIVAVGDKPVVYNAIFIPGFTSLMTLGMTGDISGLANLPITSYVVPSLLFEDVTLKKATGPFPTPPITAPPTLAAK